VLFSYQSKGLPDLSPQFLVCALRREAVSEEESGLLDNWGPRRFLKEESTGESGGEDWWRRRVVALGWWGPSPVPRTRCPQALSRGCLLSPAGISRLDDQIFLNRNPGVPSVVKFHPFTPCIAVADKDSIWYELLRVSRALAARSTCGRRQSAQGLSRGRPAACRSFPRPRSPPWPSLPPSGQSPPRAQCRSCQHRTKSLATGGAGLEGCKQILTFLIVTYN